MKIEVKELLRKLEEMKKEGYDYLVKITAVDYNDHLDVIYFIRDLEKNRDETVEVTLQNNKLEVPSVINYSQGADWYERELSEMFGIKITGRRAPRLLLEKWDGKNPPLRKSFVWGKGYD